MRRFLLRITTILVLSAVVSWNGLAQESPRVGHVFDTALIFRSDAGERAKAKLEKEMADASLETGAQLIFRTESMATGSSAKKIAASVAAEVLDSTRPGAVMVYIRSDNSIGVAVTEGSGGIPAYVFSTVEKAGGAKPSNLEAYVYGSRAAREMTAVFTKYYGPNAGKGDPRKRGDKILMVVMAAAIVIMTFVFVALSRRQPASVL